MFGLAVSLLLGAQPAAAATLSFGCISNNLAADCAIGEAQLSVDVTDGGGGQVLFSFAVTGPDPAVITDVYFDDGSLLAIASIVNDVSAPQNVQFSAPAVPANLPAAINALPPFNVTAGFSADADAGMGGATLHGVNNLAGDAETLGIRFTLGGVQTLADVLAELSDGRLRIGIHVQAYLSGGSESFVNHALPEPTTVRLLGLGLVAIAGARLRRS